MEDLIENGDVLRFVCLSRIRHVKLCVLLFQMDKTF